MSIKMKGPPMIVRAEIECSFLEQYYISESSPERVLNEAIRLLRQKRFTNEVCQDIEDCKDIITRLWNSARNDIFINNQK